METQRRPLGWVMRDTPAWWLLSTILVLLTHRCRHPLYRRRSRVYAGLVSMPTITLCAWVPGQVKTQGGSARRPNGVYRPLSENLICRHEYGEVSADGTLTPVHHHPWRRC